MASLLGDKQSLKELHPWMCITVNKKSGDNQSVASSKSEITEKSESA
jgi:hypothetical protein